MIERSNPDVGYIAPATFNEINVSQVVKANGLVHYSGIVAAGPDGSCVKPGDLAEQVRWIFEVLRRLLEKDQLTMKNLVSITVYTTDIEQLAEHMGIFTETFKEAAPASTWVEVRKLASPDFLLEIAAVAAV